MIPWPFTVNLTFHETLRHLGKVESKEQVCQYGLETIDEEQQ